ncbi:MAG: TldD/PmbA family protein [Candidatus Edwardsbacteria bacterium]
MQKERIKKILPEIIASLEKKIPYASALVTASEGNAIFIDNQEQRISEIIPTVGTVFTAFNGLYFEERAFSSVEERELLKEAKRLREEVYLQRGKIKINPGEPLVKDSHTTCQIDPRRMPLQEKFSRLKKLQAELQGLDKRIINARVSYQEVCEEKIFANRTRLLSQELLRTEIALVIFVSNGQRMEYDWLIKAKMAGWETTEIKEEEIDKLKNRALELLQAEKITPGTYEVVADSSVSGTIAHEAFGHGVELDMFLKNRAKGKDYISKRIASPLVTMIDDPSLLGENGSYFFDDEGELATPTIIIKDGVLLRGLSDLYSASALRVPRSANGRRESFARKTYARMSNTFFAKGESKIEEMINSLEEGIYLEKASSGMEDPKNWGIQVEVKRGREVKSGRFTGKIFSPTMITGYVPDLLKNIKAVGEDFSLEGGGLCGKGHKEYVRVSSGGPHLRLRARLG